MDKIFNFLEKIGNNKRRNGILAALSGLFVLILPTIIVFFTILCKFSIKYIVFLAFSYVLFVFFTLSFGFFVFYEKVRQSKEALNLSEKYLRILEEENKDYKMNVEVLLNDKDIQDIINIKRARQNGSSRTK